MVNMRHSWDLGGSDTWCLSNTWVPRAYTYILPYFLLLLGPWTCYRFPPQPAGGDAERRAPCPYRHQEGSLAPHAQTKTHVEGWPRFSVVPHYPELAKPESDGPFCFFLQRRISILLSPALAAHVTPNAATGLNLSMGLAAAGLFLMGHWLAAVAMIHVFGVFSCVDGEIARLRGEASQLGDFLDTMTDRGTEAALVLAMTASLAGRLDLPWVWPVGSMLLCGVWLLTVSSEKFRSSYGRGYPKRHLEPIFAWLSAGSDVRLLVLSVGFGLAQLQGQALIGLWTMAGLALLTHVNFLVRIYRVSRHFAVTDANQDVSP